MKDGKHVILYIDDDQDFLTRSGRSSRRTATRWSEASSAEEGLRVYKALNPDFVIVDLMMEEVDAGASFVKELKALGNKAPSTCSARWATTSA